MAAADASDRVCLGSTGEALIAESTIAALPSPDRKTLKAFRFNFFHGRPGSEEAFPMLGGRSATLYDDPDDLIALPTTETSDRLTMFVQDNFGFLFKVKRVPSHSIRHLLTLSRMPQRQEQHRHHRLDMRRAKRLRHSSPGSVPSWQRSSWLVPSWRFTILARTTSSSD